MALASGTVAAAAPASEEAAAPTSEKIAPGAETTEEDRARQPREPQLWSDQLVPVAGTGERGYSGDGGDALDARLESLSDIDVSPDGTVYVVDSFNSRLRAVTYGVIDTVAGTRAKRAPDREVEVADGWIWSPRNTPRAVAVGPEGVVYVAASQNVYRLGPDGQPEIIAGGGELYAEEAEGGPATEAWVHDPSDVAVDADGNVFVADGVNPRIRKIDADGTISTVAGGGELDAKEAEGEPATEAYLGARISLAVDSRGTVYFARESAGVVWMVSADGTLEVAVDGAEGDSTGDDAELASQAGAIRGLTFDAEDTLYLADAGRGRVRRLTTEGVMSSVGPPLADVGSLSDVSVAANGDVFVAVDSRVLMIVQSVTQEEAEQRLVEGELGPDPWSDEEPGTTVTVAGTGEPPPPPAWDGSASRPEARSDVVVGPDGVVYYADPDDHRVMSVSPRGDVEVVAGTGKSGFSGDDGPATEARLDTPSGLDVDDGVVYVADGANGRIRTIDADGVISTIAGGTPSLRYPRDVAVGEDGTVYVADSAGERIRAVAPDGTIDTVAGGGDLWADEADGEPATEASLWEPASVAVDANGTVYFTESGMPFVRMVHPDGILATVAGDSYQTDEGGFSGDGGPATEAELNTPRGLAVGPDGALYVADTWNSRVRKVDVDGVVTTVAGTGERDDDGDGGPADEAAVNEPEAVALDADGNLYVAGRASDVIRRVDTGGVISTFARHPGATDPDLSGRSLAVDTALDRPHGLAVDAAGALYITDALGGGLWQVDPDGTIGRVDVASWSVDPWSVDPFQTATSVAADDRGVLYVGDAYGLWKRYPDGAAVWVAGVEAGSVNFPANDSAAVVTHPTDLDIAPDGTVLLVDWPEHRIYALGADGEPIPRAEGLTASGLAAAGDGVVYLADRGKGVVHRLAQDGTVEIFAGGEPDPFGDGADARHGPAREVPMSGTTDVAVAADGIVYVSSRMGIWRVETDGSAALVYESPIDEDGSSTTYFSPTMLALDAHDNLYFSEPSSNVVRVLVRPGEMRVPGGSDGISDPFPWQVPAAIVWGCAGAVLALVVWRRRRGGEEVLQVEPSRYIV